MEVLHEVYNKCAGTSCRCNMMAAVYVPKADAQYDSRKMCLYQAMGVFAQFCCAKRR